jgi:1,4-alpha-glucan branching enzyme
MSAAALVPPDISDAIAMGRLTDPFAWLGLHPIDPGWRIVCFDPGASEAWITDADGRRLAALTRVHPAGVFAAALREPAARCDYRLAFCGDGREWIIQDPYKFGPVLGDLDLHLLAEGSHQALYECLGAHLTEHEAVAGTSFAVWAPNARRVSVLGDFNCWDGRRHPMRLRHGAGVWEIFLPAVAAGARYKFEIVGPHGDLLPLKADPVSFRQEPAPATASIVHPYPEPTVAPGWIESLPARHAADAPISIYEVHLGSWRRGNGDRYLTYDELSQALVPYAVDMGFTHVEFLPVAEHPFSGSWGYQPIGLFAPTSRFGDPEGFGRLVHACHEANLGVIVDWVPAHFPSDAHGPARFDGTHLYEHADPRLGFHRDWNTLIYNFGRREVSNYLAANALFWLEQLGVDGLRVDAVASMLYLDYSREPGEWIPNVYGGRENLEATAVLREVNRLIASRSPGRLTIAEESTAWPGVSRPIDHGGLGFDYKWNMGWMHDTLAYMSRDPAFRKWHHHEMTFGIDYAWSERFILPLSHDEVVHGKGSLLGRMPGDRWRQFANLRAYFGFMWAHPGKKLLFMGGEFGQDREWNHDRSLDWHLLDDPSHAGLRRLVRDLNTLYRRTTALHSLDCDAAGFSWIEGGDSDQSVLSFERRGRDGTSVLVVCNFTPVVRHDYAVGVSQTGTWRELINTDAEIYGGSNIVNVDRRTAPIPLHGRQSSLRLVLPPLATVVLQSDHL